MTYEKPEYDEHLRAWQVEALRAAVCAAIDPEPYEVPPPCDCTPGDTCTCATDCDCRERDAHIWKYDAGWRNIEGLEETRRDTEVYE